MVMVCVIVSDLIESAHLDLKVNHLHNMQSPMDTGNQFYLPLLEYCVERQAGKYKAMDLVKEPSMHIKCTSAFSFFD